MFHYFLAPPLSLNKRAPKVLLGKWVMDGQTDIKSKFWTRPWVGWKYDTIWPEFSFFSSCLLPWAFPAVECYNACFSKIWIYWGNIFDPNVNNQQRNGECKDQNWKSDQIFDISLQPPLPLYALCVSWEAISSKFLDSPPLYIHTFFVVNSRWVLERKLSHVNLNI